MALWEERTVKLSLSKLTGGAPDSRLLNDVFNEFVLYTSRIRVMGQIIINLTLHRYVNEQEQLIAANANHEFRYTPANLRFDDQAFVYQSFNRAFHANPTRITSSPHLRQTVEFLNANNAAFPHYRPFPDYDGEFDFGGKSQIIGYLRLMYIANFRSSTPAKSMAIINDGIKALKQTHLNGLTRDERNEQLTEIKRQLFYPFRQAPAGVQLSQVYQDFVNFHRNGDHRALSGGTSTPPLGDDDGKESATRTPDQVEKSIEQASAQLSQTSLSGAKRNVDRLHSPSKPMHPPLAFDNPPGITAQVIAESERENTGSHTQQSDEESKVSDIDVDEITNDMYNDSKKDWKHYPIKRNHSRNHSM